MDFVGVGFVGVGLGVVRVLIGIGWLIMLVVFSIGVVGWVRVVVSCVVLGRGGVLVCVGVVDVLVWVWVFVVVFVFVLVLVLVWVSVLVFSGFLGRIMVEIG